MTEKSVRPFLHTYFIDCPQGTITDCSSYKIILNKDF